MLETGKLYLVQTISLEGTGDTARVELKGTVNLIVYGSEDEQDSVAEMTAASESLTADSYYSFDTLPKYVAFIGTADRINIGGYKTTEIKDIS